MCIGVVVPVAESFMQPACAQSTGLNGVYYAVAPVPVPPTPEKGDARHSRVCHVDVDDQLLGKTKLCKFFLKGHCSRGRACTFAHGRKELRSAPNLFKTEMCYEFTNRGWCHRGPECKYAHGVHELRCNQAQGMQQQTAGAAVKAPKVFNAQSNNAAPAMARQGSGRDAVARTNSTSSFSSSGNTMSMQEFSRQCSSSRSPCSNHSSSASDSSTAAQIPGFPEVESSESDVTATESNDGELVWAIEKTFFTLVSKNAQPTLRRRSQSAPPSARA